MRIGSILITVFLWTASNAALADCSYPKAPDSVPDGKSAAQAEMVAAMNLFKQYNADVTAYLACLDQETAAKVKDAAGSTGAIMQIKSLQSKKYNSAVDELKNTTNKFNEEIRIFKARK